MKTEVLRSYLVALGLTLASSNSLAQATQSYTVPDGTRIQAKLESTINSRTNRQGDRFSAKVIESVMLEGKEVIPAGTTLEGRVAEVKPASRARSKGEINLTYERLIFPNGVSETIVASASELSESEKEQIDRKEGTIKGESTQKRDAGEVAGGAAAGAGIGAIAGGGKGAAIGAGVGGLIGLADSLRRKGKEVELPAGTKMVIRLDRPLTIMSTK
ncbi:MAG TPA: YMGG-like glycine zipper-containing protein [Terriglobia bacterium]|nr:YMGG-like glycine zipper-containing protein [Terriglobia bacterium]